MRCATNFILLLGVLFGSTRCENIAAEFGSFTSGGFPTPYVSDVDRTWNITVSDGFCVRLIFTVFDLEDSYEKEEGFCVYDYVKVDNGSRMCGNAEKHNPNAPGPYKVIRSPGNKMTVRFVSDYSNEDPHVGFEAHFRAEDRNECHELRKKLNGGEEHWDEVIYCNHFCHNVPGSYYCSCRQGFTLHDNKHTCIADCSENILTGENGTLSSPDYPQPYSKLSNCQRIIKVGYGSEIEIRFDPLFDIEEHYQEGCAYDWIKLILPNNNVKYCGSVAPNNGSWINLHSSSVIVEFHSDMVTEKAGYKLEYRAAKQRCDSEIVGALNNGSLIDLNDKGFHEHEDSVEFRCNVGYNLVGSSTSSCQAGSWVPPPPTCQIVYCPRPEDLLNIDKTVVQNVDNIQLHFNSTIVINCIEWYRMASGSAEWFCNHDATWQPRKKSSIFQDDNLPICEPQCGVKTQVGGRSILGIQIIGGKFSRVAEWPWMAFLDLRKKGLSTQTSFCAGSLVHERYVVTAAHCVMSGSGFSVYLGVTDRSNSSNPHVQVFNAEEVYSHVNFSFPLDINSIMDSDIAVIKLNASAVIGRYVRPICIPRSDRQKNLPQLGLLDSPEYQKRGVIAGWGLTEYGTPSLRLKQTRVPFFNHTTCRRVFALSKIEDASTYARIKINHNMFCAGFIYKSRDSCQGDSGGPLMYRDLRTNRWFLNGIVSFGTSRNCTPVNVLGVYTKVGNFISFLYDHII